MATFNYVALLEWVRARENLLLVGPAGTGKSHVLVGTGLRAVEHGLRVRYATAADLIEQLYRGLADNTVSRVIDGLLRNDMILIDEVVGFAPLDETGTQLLFRLVAAAYERRSIGLASHWPFEDWGMFLPMPSTAPPLGGGGDVRRVVAPQGSARPGKRAACGCSHPGDHHCLTQGGSTNTLTTPRGGDFCWPPVATSLVLVQI